MAEAEQVLDEGGAGGDEQQEPSAEVLQEAKMLGWVDKEQFRGRPEDWVPADEFVERGKHVLPILKANNERLMNELRGRDGRLMQMSEQLKIQGAALKAMEDAQAEDTEAERVATIAELEDEIAQASSDGDFKRVASATTKLTKLQAEAIVQERLKGGDPNARQGGGNGGVNPQHVEVLSWFDTHPTFKQGRKLALMNAIADEMRQAGDTRTGLPFLDAVGMKVDEALGGSPGGGSSRVSGGNGGSGRGGSGEGGGVSKSYADLPKDAKEACDKFSKRMVGPGKKYQTVEAWRKSYTAKYFEEA